MNFESHPDNSNPFQLIKELDAVEPGSPLNYVAGAFRASPLEAFNRSNVATYPTLPNRDWTDKELGEISRWLHEIIGITEASLISLREVLSYPTATKETRDEFAALDKLSIYLDLFSTAVYSQKGLLAEREAQSRAALLACISDDRLQALLGAQLHNPGEA